MHAKRVVAVVVLIGVSLSVLIISLSAPMPGTANLKDTYSAAASPAEAREVPVVGAYAKRVTKFMVASQGWMSQLLAAPLL